MGVPLWRGYGMVWTTWYHGYMGVAHVSRTPEDMDPSRMGPKRGPKWGHYGVGKGVQNGVITHYVTLVNK